MLNINKNERGFALLIVIAAMLILAIMTAGIISLSKATFAQQAHEVNYSRALDVAEAGLEKALWELNNNSNWDGETYTLHDSSGDSIGSYTVVASPVSGQPSKLMLQSTGYVPAQNEESDYMESRIIQIVINRTDFEGDWPKDALIAETLLDAKGNDQVHGRGRVGQNINTSGNVHDPQDIFDYDYTTYDDDDTTYSNPLTAHGSVTYNLNTDDDPDNDIALPFDDYMLDQFKQIAIQQQAVDGITRYFDHEPNGAEDHALTELGSFYFEEPSAENPFGVPNIIFIEDRVHLSGNREWYGTIFATGDRAWFSGSLTIEGVIYTKGQFRGMGGGNAEYNIHGAVIANSAGMNGHATIEYHKPYLDSLNALALANTEYRLESWDEIMVAQN